MNTFLSASDVSKLVNEISHIQYFKAEFGLNDEQLNDAIKGLGDLDLLITSYMYHKFGCTMYPETNTSDIIDGQLLLCHAGFLGGDPCAVIPSVKYDDVWFRVLALASVDEFLTLQECELARSRSMDITSVDIPF